MNPFQLCSVNQWYYKTSVEIGPWGSLQFFVNQGQPKVDLQSKFKGKFFGEEFDFLVKKSLMNLYDLSLDLSKKLSNW